MLPMRDDDDDEQQLKIELLSQWKLEAESRNLYLHCLGAFPMSCPFSSLSRSLSADARKLAGGR